MLQSAFITLSPPLSLSLFISVFCPYFSLLPSSLYLSLPFNQSRSVYAVVLTVWTETSAGCSGGLQRIQEAHGAVRMEEVDQWVGYRWGSNHCKCRDKKMYQESGSERETWKAVGVWTLCLNTLKVQSTRPHLLVLHLQVVLVFARHANS